ncbi:hypothetical protein [Paraflavitalea speifideaquila]|uniref:hypothetical protein n=1 Tax=Paraflavitalea speifideaquila TaxID=3076558 RepID=UPI0028F0555A|nr:hypothetical protein [Paraflavitalea speifideiaquila]
MQKKNIILFIISILFIVGFLLLPQNRQWWATVLSYAHDFKKQHNHLDRETRMTKRFGNDYLFQKILQINLIKKVLKEKCLY